MEVAELPSFFVFILGPFTEVAREQAACMFISTTLIKGFIFTCWSMTLLGLCADMYVYSVALQSSTVTQYCIFKTR